MKKKSKKDFCIAVCMFAAFALWTLAVKIVDVCEIGPQGSKVGFATLNKLVHDITGVHMTLYTVTDWLSLVPLGFVLGFGILGFCQLIIRKSLFKVDRSILALGVYYIAIVSIFLLFEVLVVNYRPVLINGYLEASYPSSTTMLVLCVMPTAVMQFNERLKSEFLKRVATVVIWVFTIFMVVMRLFSGVHWFSDIVGGALLSIGLVRMYKCFCTEKK